MSKLLTGFLIVVLFAACKQQNNKTGKTELESVATNETEQNIYKSGDSMLAAFKRKDWIGFVKYNHPNMTKRMGGPEAFASFINTQMKQIPDPAVKDIALGKILQVVKTPEDEQCIVEQNMTLGLGGNTFNKTTYLIGESLDRGSTWTFFDASTKTTLSPIDIKPNLSPELKIPGAKKMTE